MRCLKVSNGVPGGIRTPGLRIRSPLLYPAELQGQKNGAGRGNRTLATSLEGWGSATELHPPAKCIITLFRTYYKKEINFCIGSLTMLVCNSSEAMSPFTERAFFFGKDIFGFIRHKCNFTLRAMILIFDVNNSLYPC
jgi:hypothetical protein